MDLTPFGMLVSGRLQARSWKDFDAGQARSSLPVMGFGWVFPSPAFQHTESSLFATIYAGNSRYHTRSAFDLAGLNAIHHGPSLITYACSTIEWSIEISYFLGHDGEFIVEVLDLRPLHRVRRNSTSDWARYMPDIPPAVRRQRSIH